MHANSRLEEGPRSSRRGLPPWAGHCEVVVLTPTPVPPAVNPLDIRWGCRTESPADLLLLLLLLLLLQLLQLLLLLVLLGVTVGRQGRRSKGSASSQTGCPQGRELVACAGHKLPALGAGCLG